MEHTFEVIFEKGQFLIPPPFSKYFAEGQHVRIKVEDPPFPEKVLEAACRVYDGLSAREIENLEHIILDRSNFFADRMTE